MVGICGIVGENSEEMDFDTDLSWRGHESRATFESDDLRIVQYGHDRTVDDLPVRIDGDARMWIWGDVYGFSAGDGYVSRTDEGSSTVEFVKKHLGDDWRDSVVGLNGSFVVLIHEPDARDFHVVADKLSSRSIYYTIRNDTLLFSPRVQALYAGNDITPEPNRDQLNVYFSSMRSLGLETPIAETYSCPPGSISTFDLDSAKMTEHSYWQPVHEPVDEPIEWFVEQFVERLEGAVAERVADGAAPALLLSGGSDSRLIAAMLDRLNVDFTAYHTTTWESSYETIITKTVADLLDVELRLLRRDADFFSKLLGENLSLLNFDGSFEQAHLEPFMDEICDDEELLLTGHFGDTLCKGLQIPSRVSSQLEGIKHFEQLNVSNVDDLISFFVGQSQFEPPHFFAGEKTFYDIMNRDITQEGERIHYHGIEFPSIDDYLMSSGVYPANDMSDAYFRRTLRENLRLRTPFVDDRILELMLQMPRDMLFDNNIIDRSIAEVDPSLATIVSASSDVAPLIPDRYQLNVRYAELNLPEPPAEWQAHSPWGYHGYLSGERRDELVAEAIAEHRDLIESSDFLDDGLIFNHDVGPANGPPFGHRLRDHTRSFLSFICSPIAEKMCSTG